MIHGDLYYGKMLQHKTTVAKSLYSCIMKIDTGNVDKTDNAKGIYSRCLDINKVTVKDSKDIPPKIAIDISTNSH